MMNSKSIIASLLVVAASGKRMDHFGLHPEDMVLQTQILGNYSIHSSDGSQISENDSRVLNNHGSIRSLPGSEGGQRYSSNGVIQLNSSQVSTSASQGSIEACDMEVQRLRQLLQEEQRKKADLKALLQQVNAALNEERRTKEVVKSTLAETHARFVQAHAAWEALKTDNVWLQTELGKKGMELFEGEQKLDQIEILFKNAERKVEEAEKRSKANEKKIAKKLAMVKNLLDLGYLGKTNNAPRTQSKSMQRMRARMSLSHRK